MKKLLLIVTVFLFCTQNVSSTDSSGNWPKWRGPNDNGVTVGSPPIEWSESLNIKWKTPIPGTGHATPIVWKGRIYVQTADGAGSEGDKLRFKLLAIDQLTGKQIWEKTLRESSPAESKHHNTASFVSTSGITDGKHLYAYFGSQGLYCLDFEGKIVWEKDLGDMRTRNSFGEGSSPSIQGNTLVVNWDQEDDSFIVALDKRSGKELWRRTRDEVTSWGTPLIVKHKKGHQVVVSASDKTRSYDLKTGDIIWEVAGLGTNAIPMPLHENGVVYVTSGHRSPAMLAIILNKAKGDITGTDAVLWSITQNTPYVSSPVLQKGRLYFSKNRNAILSCYDAKTGEIIFGPERLIGMGHLYASFVGVEDRIYIADLNGNTLVVKNGTKFEPLATNALDDSFSASPIVIGNELYLRGNNSLYCIAKAK